MLQPGKKNAFKASKPAARLTALALWLASALPQGAFVVVTFEDKPGTGGCTAVFNSCFYEHVSDPDAGAICGKVLTQCESSSGTNDRKLSSFVKNPLSGRNPPPRKNSTVTGGDTIGTGDTGDSRPTKTADYSKLTPQAMTNLFYNDFFPTGGGAAGNDSGAGSVEETPLENLTTPTNP